MYGIVYVSDMDGNDLLSYWPALEGCEAHTLQKWGSERRLGGDYSKDAANNNQPDAALTSGDENGLSHRHRKGEAHIHLKYYPILASNDTYSLLLFYFYLDYFCRYQMLT